MLIEVYTDGSATVASKPGGYGYVLVINGQKHSEGHGHIERATNNDAEMEAAIQGLAATVRFLMQFPDIPLPEVHLRSDSQIVLNWANGTSRFKQDKKMAKYRQLSSLMQRLRAKTVWVRGHNGHEHNERCDVLASMGRLKMTEEEFLQSRSSRGKVRKERKTNKAAKIVENKAQSAMAVWYRGRLRIVNFETGAVEIYNKELHGTRTSSLEFRQGNPDN